MERSLLGCRGGGRGRLAGPFEVYLVPKWLTAIHLIVDHCDCQLRSEPDLRTAPVAKPARGGANQPLGMASRRAAPIVTDYENFHRRKAALTGTGRGDIQARSRRSLTML